MFVCLYPSHLWFPDARWCLLKYKIKRSTPIYYVFIYIYLKVQYITSSELPSSPNTHHKSIVMTKQMICMVVGRNPTQNTKLSIILSPKVLNLTRKSIL